MTRAPSARPPTSAMPTPAKPQIAQLSPESLISPELHEYPLLKMGRPDTACSMARAVQAPNPALNTDTRTTVDAAIHSNIRTGGHSCRSPEIRSTVSTLISLRGPSSCGESTTDHQRRRLGYVTSQLGCWPSDNCAKRSCS